MANTDLPEYLSRKQAADFLTGRGLIITVSALEKLAYVGDGPEYRIFGRRAVYLRQDLVAWARSHMTEPCTAARKQASQAEVANHA